jgi:hypothetical protein
MNANSRLRLSVPGLLACYQTRSAVLYRSGT